MIFDPEDEFDEVPKGIQAFGRPSCLVRFASSASDWPVVPRVDKAGGLAHVRNLYQRFDWRRETLEVLHCMKDQKGFPAFGY